jgi:hypothetical protein
MRFDLKLRSSAGGRERVIVRLTLISFPCSNNFLHPRSFFAHPRTLSRPSSPSALNARLISLSVHIRDVSDEYRCRTCAKPLTSVITPPVPRRLCDTSSLAVLNWRWFNIRKAGQVSPGHEVLGSRLPPSSPTKP